MLSLIDTIANSVTAFSAFVGAVIAFYSIKTWRREIIFKRRYELAEEVLTLFYEAENKIHLIRSPCSNSDEGSTRSPQRHELPEEADIKRRAYIPIERYQKCEHIFNKLYSHRPRFAAVFGNDLTDPFDQLRALITRILSNCRLVEYHWLKQGEDMSEDEFNRHLQSMEKADAVMWEVSSPDPISNEVKNIVLQMDSICEKILRK